MKNMKAERSRIGWVLTVGLGLLVTPSFARAEELKKFTGYTRPGIPTAPPGPIQVAGDNAEGAIGATVYFKVFERGNDDEGDPWGTGFVDLDRWFVPGQASRGRNAESLDTSARYLYLYQVVNDSYRPAQLKSVAVRIIIPPHLITSWGHFAERKDKGAGRGVGFSMLFDHPDPKTPKAKGMTLPLSTEHAGVNDDLYRDPAPYFYPPKPYALSRILLNNKPMPLTDGEDTGREPERVVLQTTYNFEGAPNWLVKDGVAGPLMPFLRPGMPGANLGNPFFNPANPLMPPGMGGMGVAPAQPGVVGAKAAGPDDALRRAPAVVAYWNDNPLLPAVAGNRPGQRSTIFGFTSNFPPVYEDVRVRGNAPPPFKGPAAPAADAGPANLRADGEVPTPVAYEQAIAPPGHAPGNFGGPIGQVGAGGGLLRGGGGMGGGFGFGFPFGGGGFGGGGGGMMGGGGGGTSTPSTTTTSTTTPVATGTLLGLLLSRLPLATQSQAVNVSVAQSQSQAQAQAQAQGQGQSSKPGVGGHHGHVVPEPAAIVSALLGLPVLVLLIWRRKTAAPLPA
ncbi:MAG TPA: hypothetical protein VMG10_31390 [Gemmataceae bacterium]|nr:hypothetical protein [Gemmataceae bacterium]